MRDLSNMRLEDLNCESNLTHFLDL